jgi:hypothetical protein
MRLGTKQGKLARHARKKFGQSQIVVARFSDANFKTVKTSEKIRVTTTPVGISARDGEVIGNLRDRK